MILLFHPEAKNDIKAIAENYAAVSIGIKRYEKKLERSKSLKKVCENLMEKLQVDSTARPQFFWGFRSHKARFEKRLSRIDSESVQWGGEGDLIPPIFGVWCLVFGSGIAS